MGLFSSIGKAFKGLGGSVLGLAGDVVGGVLGLSGTKSANDSQAALAQAQMAYQKELAQNQIQWRVEDAKKAGIHPLAALGVSSASYSPVSANFQSPDYSFISDMGQNLNRAIMQGKTAREREQAQARQDEFDSINLRRARAEADHAETVAASERLRLQRELFPPAPKANDNSTFPSPRPDGPFTDKPIVRDGWLLDEKGRKISVIPSEAMKGRTEDVLGVEWFPFISSAYRDARGRMLGHEINGHWWHGLDKGYLPYPPKAVPRSSRAKVSDYYFRSYRY